MGGATSRFSDTDWETADGGLTSTEETIDEAKPTERHSIISLNKNSLVSQREYEIRDDQDILLYTTKGVTGTVKWFDLMGKGGEKILRVQCDLPPRLNWEIFRYAKQTFPEQEADPAASEKAGEALYKKAAVTITWDRHHGHVAMFVPPKAKTEREGETEAKSEGEAEEVHELGGVLMSDDPVLKVEEIQSITAQFQTMLPGHGLLGMDNAEDREKKQPNKPLVGFWVWESTLKVHKMKMHIAKGADLALHVVLAVLTNMIVTERTALQQP